VSRLVPPVRCVEVRADLTGDIDPRSLRGGFTGSLLYTLRSTAEGGECPDSLDRGKRLIAAASHYDFVDLEASRDLHPQVLDRIEPYRRVISWHGPATDLPGLRKRLGLLTAVEAHLYRLAPHASTQSEALVPLRLLKSAGRRDVTAYATGQAGTWTRVLAARFGAPLAFGLLGASPDGDLPLDRLLAEYPLRALSRAERVFGIIGGSTAASLSPLVHNTAYQVLGLPAIFLPFSSGELTRSLAALRAGLDELGLPVGGMTVVAPHKESAFALAAQASPMARRVGAANLLVRTPSGWWGDTEADGVVAALTERRVELCGQRVAVVGCGGAGRAAAAGLTQADAQVTLVNRGLSRGKRAADRLDLPFVTLREFDPAPFSVLINATPVTDTLLFRIDGLDPSAVLFDLNYGAAAPRMVAAARAGGHVTIDGRHMLLAEVSRQFRLMTAHHMPRAEVCAALGVAAP
jgi:3-dehydroquinate dehydratase/shikimate dehydrogenase